MTRASYHLHPVPRFVLYMFNQMFVDSNSASLLYALSCLPLTPYS